MTDKLGSVAVLGGGISGMQAALDLAESGLKVYLVDNKSAIGGVMAQLDKTFPTNDCAMCTMAPRLVEIGRHKDIEIITLSDVEKVEGEAGNFKLILHKKPRYIDEDKCTGCGTCITNCPTRNIVQPLEKVKVELEPQYKEKVMEIIRSNKDKKGPLMTILQQVNSTYNYLPENVEPLYASVLMPPATVMAWGTGQYMYVNRRSINNTLKRVIRVTMGKNSAPYYGRQ